MDYTAATICYPDSLLMQNNTTLNIKPCIFNFVLTLTADVID